MISSILHAYPDQIQGAQLKSGSANSLRCHDIPDNGAI